MPEATVASGVRRLNQPSFSLPVQGVCVSEKGEANRERGREGGREGGRKREGGREGGRVRQRADV